MRHVALIGDTDMLTMTPTSIPSRLELQLGLRAETISVIRRFIESLYGQFVNQETASRMSLTVHELMDNAARCAYRGEVTMTIEVTGDTLQISTQNHAQPGDIACLERIMSEMESHTDAFSYYLELMNRTAGRQDMSGLGLGRIWAEADMTLSYETSVDTVSICAHMPLVASKGSST